MRKASVLALLAMLIPLAGVCKCGGLAIHLKGHVSGGEVDGLKIVAETTPDANFEPQPKIAVQHGSFAGEAYFDRTIPSKVWYTDICTRLPKSVKVKLFRGKHLVGSISLDISKDFVRDELGDYKLRAPIEFHLR
jgi:hypothetical protein